MKIYCAKGEHAGRKPLSFQKSTGDSMHMPHILTLLNKYIISTRFAKKFLT